MIEIIQSKAELKTCIAILRQLHTSLTDDEWLPLYEIMHREGYQLVCSKEHEQIRAVMGFRITTNLSFRKSLYIDDLVTDEHHRSTGHGTALIEWAVAYAKQHQCLTLILDSGVSRHKAHKFYLNQGMDILCYHFIKKLI